MHSVAQIRRMFKDCEGHSDEEVLRAYHAKFYGDTSYDDFQRQYAEAEEARNTRGRKGSSSSSKGPDRTRQAMDRAGLGYDKESGNYYPYLRDEKGKLVLDEKGARMQDYDRGAAEPGMIEEILRKQNGQGLQRPQPAQQPAQPVAQQVTPETAAIAEAEAYRVPEVGEIMAGISGIAGQKSAALMQGMQMQRNAAVIDANFQDAAADIENYGLNRKQGLQGAIGTNFWGDVSPEDSGVMAERARQAEAARQREMPIQNPWDYYGR